MGALVDEVEEGTGEDMERCSSGGYPNFLTHLHKKCQGYKCM